MKRSDVKRARQKVERVRDMMMEAGYHFPNDELTLLDEAIVELGGKSAQEDEAA